MSVRASSTFITRSPLALRLALGFAAISASGSVILGLTLRSLADSVVELDAKNLHLAVTDDMARSARDTLEESRHSLLAVAAALDDKEIQPAEQLRTVQALVKTSEALLSVAVYDENGKLLEVVGDTSDTAKRPYDAVMQQQALTETRPCGVEKMCIEHRITWRSGTLIGRTNVAKLSGLTRELSRRRFASDADRIVLLTEKGEVIAGNSLIEPLSEDSALFRQDAAVTRLQEDEEGTPVLRTYAALPDLRWVIAIDQPLRVAMAVQAQTHRRIALTVLLTILASLVAGFVVARSQTQSVRKLAMAAERVAAGDYSVRLETGGGDEVAELSRKFNNMVKELGKVAKLHDSLRHSETMAAMGQLVSGVAHEVRNPLFGISAGLDALELEVGEGSPYLDYLVAIRASVERLNQLMRDLLDYGRPHDEQLVTADLRDVVTEAVRACAPLAAKCEVTIQVEFDEEPMMMQMRRHRLTQVYQNLIQNAVQFSPKKGIVRVVGHMEADRYETFVLDSGVGLKPDDMEKLFVPFFTKRQGGTGLGLSIVKRIVEDHGGVITLGNQAGGAGAVASVSLPGFRGV